MKKVRLHDKEFQVSIEAAAIDREIERVAGEINRDLQGERPLFLSILNGAFMFTSDLLKCITLEGTEVSFVKIASYAGTSSTGRVRELIGLNEDITGRTLVIVEYMVDSGKSMVHLKEMLQKKGPKQIRIAAMFYKPKALVHELTVDYHCFALENDFVVGRGLDYDGLGRNLPDLYTLCKD